MKVKISERNGILIRHFTGEVHLQDIIGSWYRIFDSYPDLGDYRGVISNFLDSKIIMEDEHLNDLVDFLASNLDHCQNMKIAVVMEKPLFTYTIILDQKLKSLQIKPFTVESEALQWFDGDSA